MIKFKPILIKYAFVALLSVLSIGPFTNSPDFIFIEICETTGGGNIGAPADYEHMYRFAEGAANQADMGFKSYRFEKDQLSEEQFKQFLSQLEVKSDDFVFFYFSGHGFNNPGSDLTAFRLGNKKYTMDWVERQLKATGSRLQVVMFEACNHELNGSLPIVNNATPNRFKYRKLFAKASGSLKFASNTPGYQQYSYGNSDSGSVFTNAFINAVDKVVREADTTEEATWTKIVTVTKNLTEQLARELGEEQSPIAKNDITEGSIGTTGASRDTMTIEQINNLEDPD